MTTKHFLSFASLFLIFLLPAQNITMDFEASTAYPFGRINPDAPEQLKDFGEWGDGGSNFCLPRRDSIARYLIETWIAENS